jgi:hypothetical protein
VSDIRKILNDSRINVSGFIKSIEKKGLSRSSVLNKLDDNHRHIMTDDDMKCIEDALRQLSKDIEDTIK